jgi:hypothetical protein
MRQHRNDLYIAVAARTMSLLIDNPEPTGSVHIELSAFFFPVFHPGVVVLGEDRGHQEVDLLAGDLVAAVTVQLGEVAGDPLYQADVLLGGRDFEGAGLAVTAEDVADVVH